MPSSSELTEMQEKTSAWIFDRALNDNVKYASPDEIWKDVNFQKNIIGTKSKQGIYPYVDQDWVKTFYKQQKRFLVEFSDAKFKEFSVKGGFMEFVSKLVNKKYGISKKDAWDPADVWCVQNEKQVIKEITDTVDTSNDIEKLNALLRTFFQERKVVGISLKKVGNKESVARYQEVNIKDGVLFTSGKHPTFDIEEIRYDLLLRPDGTFKANDLRIFFTVKYTKEEVKYTLTVRTSGRTYNPGNLIFEFQEPGAAAQIGKAPVNLVIDAGKKHGITIDNNWKNFATTASDFNSNIKEYKKQFNSIKKKSKTQIDSDIEFSTSMMKMLNDKDNYGTANSKLMQLDFLYKILSIGNDGMEKFITDLFFLAEKRGKGFGPFGKIY